MSNSEFEERSFGNLYRTYQKADVSKLEFPVCLQLLENRDVSLKPSYQMMELELLAYKDSEDGAVPYEQ